MAALYDFGVLTDDAGSPLATPTPTLAEVVTVTGSAVASPSVVLHLAGPRLAVEYDAVAKGPAWVKVTVSGTGATVTGANARRDRLCVPDPVAALGDPAEVTVDADGNLVASVAGYAAGANPAEQLATGRSANQIGAVLEAILSGEGGGSGGGGLVTGYATGANPLEQVVGSQTGSQLGAVAKKLLDAITDWTGIGLRFQVASGGAAPAANAFRIAAVGGGQAPSGMDDAYKTQFAYFRTGALVGQKRQVLAYSQSTGLLTTVNFAGAPAAGDVLVIY